MSDRNSTASRPLWIRHQIGLKAVRVSHRHNASVNVHDPVAGKYHRLREDEYFLLCRLDGDCSLNDLRDAYENRYPNRRVTPAQLNALLFRFHESGLVVSSSTNQGASLLLRSDRERRRRWLSTMAQWLFIRFPSADPAPVMRWINPIARPLLSTAGVAITAVFVAVSLITMVVHCQRFVDKLPTASQWMTFENAILLAVVVGLTKIAHELGHAAVSERFGARCRGIGPMLLVFTPALYCDTSASWMLASRWKRAAVSLAGIATEVMIASVAVWVWLYSSPGVVHTIASHVMLVCGVSTVFFNANPLLRYDGYYLLSDLTDVPNLGSRANRRLTGSLRRICLGVNDHHKPVERVDESTWLLLYAIAALVYRWGLMFAIIGFIWYALRPHGLAIVGQVAAVVAVTTMLIAGVVPLWKFLSDPSSRRRIRMSRLMLTTIALITVIAIGCIDFPRSVVAKARLMPSHEERVYITTGGVMSQLHVRPGDHVDRGDVLVELDNPGLQRQLVDAEGKLVEQASRIASLRQSQTLVPEATDHLAAAEEMLAQLRDEVAATKKRIDSLTVTASCEGTVIAAVGNRSRQGSSGFDSGESQLDRAVLDPDADRSPALVRNGVRLASWTGLPTDSENLRCFFEPGTELLSLVTDDGWVAEVMLDSVDVSRIEVGMAATVIWDSTPTKRIQGRVERISEERFDPSVDAHRRDHPGSARGQFTPETRYLVLITLDETRDEPAQGEPSSTPIRLVGASGRVKIATQPQSIWSRVAESLAGVFRFR